MSIESLSDKVQPDNNPDDNGNVSKPMDKVTPENKSNVSGSVSEPMDKVTPKNKSDDSGSVSKPLDKVQPEKNSDDNGSVSMLMDKVQPDNKSNDSGSVSIQKDTIQNDDIQVKVKVTNDANAQQESDGTDELFDDPPLDIFEYDLETEEHEWKHYVSDSEEINDTIPYDPKNENWHDDLSTLDGSEIAFNKQSLTMRINKLADALAKNVSTLYIHTAVITIIRKTTITKSSQASLHNGNNEDDKDSGIGSLGSKASSSHSNNAVPENESEDTG